MQRRRQLDPLQWAFLPYIAVSVTHVVLLGLDSPAAGPTKLPVSYTHLTLPTTPYV